MHNPEPYSYNTIKLLEAMTQSILITTTELDSPGPYIIYVNRAFEEMTGWSREEVIGKSPRILQGSKTNLNIFRNLGEILDTGEAWKGKTITYKKDGTEFYMEWSIAPVFDINGELDQLLAVQNDITENVKIENRLEKARKKGIKTNQRNRTSKYQTSFSDRKTEKNVRSICEICSRVDRKKCYC